MLNLAENHLTKLPQNMSMLRNLEELNLSGNPIENVEQVVDAMLSIGPNLTRLSINLHEEE